MRASLQGLLLLDWLGSLEASCMLLALAEHIRSILAPSSVPFKILKIMLWYLGLCECATKPTPQRLIRWTNELKQNKDIFH